jgi:hypothetical protein
MTMAKIETTTKKFKEGLKLTGDGSEVKWESTGHLSVRLLDASGAVPLAGRAISVEIPGEGKVSLEADPDGKAFHPDVPFQDYELDLGEGVKVHVPAVANRGDVHERHVVEVVFGFVNLHLRDLDGFGLAGGKATLSGPGGTVEIRVGRDGTAAHRDPLPEGDYDISWEHGDARFSGKVSLGDRLRGLLIASLTREGT